ncbi:hypothetical protein CMI37_07490 [Candidatus Pacearchaeota archaeon]|nr:hypothetical protein [Candidatus Pacearchaeota archaeon]
MRYPSSYTLARGQGARWVQGPLGPFISHPGRARSAYVGLSYDQWVCILIHRAKASGHPIPGVAAITRARFPGYARLLRSQAARGLGNFEDEFDGWGDVSDELDGYGDVCTRTERRYRKVRARYKRKKSKFKRRGRRFMWIRTGTGKKKLAKLRRKMKKIKAKARTKTCAWTGRKRRRKQIKRIKTEERALETQLQKEHTQAQQELEDATEMAVESQREEASKPGLNPVLILGVVAGAGLLMVALAKKK